MRKITTSIDWRHNIGLWSNLKRPASGTKFRSTKMRGTASILQIGLSLNICKNLHERGGVLGRLIGSSVEKQMSNHGHYSIGPALFGILSFGRMLVEQSGDVLLTTPGSPAQRRYPQWNLSRIYQFFAVGAVELNHRQSRHWTQVQQLTKGENQT